MAGCSTPRHGHATSPRSDGTGGAAFVTQLYGADLTHRWKPPSEFTQLRAQYRRVRFGAEPSANELFLQTLFTIEAHGAHPF